MGASTWSEFADYHPDPEVALQTRRAELRAEEQFAEPGMTPSEQLARRLRRWGLPDDHPDVVAALAAANRVADATWTEDTTGLSEIERRAVESIVLFRAFNDTFGCEMPRRPPSLPPTNLVEMLEAIDDYGSHGLLDIAHISAEPRIGHASPLSEADRMKFLGTLHPEIEDNVGLWTPAQKSLPSGQARWSFVYHRGEPVLIRFIGRTGNANSRLPPYVFDCGADCDLRQFGQRVAEPDEPLE